MRHSPHHLDRCWLEHCQIWEGSTQSEVKVVSELKNTASKAFIGPNQLKMDDKKLHTWMNMVKEKVNDLPLILGAPQGISITPNHVLLGFRNTHGAEIK